MQRTNKEILTESEGPVVAGDHTGASGRARDFTMSSTIFLDNDTATIEIYTLSLHDALPI